ncbi:MAG: sn-glycerol-3-phosphate ABC transporter ATP-binding protein UgpC [Melioribacteraceae bacterium]|nr:sn-glycerol-3-phosphate ABC transporter ATP-binding protein UgpC [Melioribacteraceae bacterium]MCF8353179.1 sn-glycerol-3-phosphate ABC transporter ATP-binding protein UgpC [Melioribacteraceae bacterium]MCF8395157.1 sn-glycerol-3-phosphate ABC transporter ATP-binding protein UgpC [Melioribacteraceae bacterium]MCF8418024.1 sn-glycerol-3-phosphate ABC transporter ATP-binding protein UgpC [Melioribacteraceae bacterium]
MEKVKLVDVTKVYEGGVTAVKKVNLEIYDKEFVVLVGPSGCGKSTTLRMIAGLEEITDGKLYIEDKLVNDVSPKDRDIAMVFQNYALYPHMTVYENMAFGLKLRKYNKEEIKQRVVEAAKILGIEDYLDKKPRVLSGGQRQRVAVGRAIVRKPKVFLFDEPLSNLDAKLRVQMRTEISKLHHKLGATMIYVTHDQTEAMTMGDRIVIMKDGVVNQIDNPLNLYNKPVNKFVAGFIGSPAMNFVDGKIIKENILKFISDDNSLNIPIENSYEDLLKSYVDKEITLGVRPEDIHAAGDNELDVKNCYEAVLDVVEPMGNEIFLYFTINGKEIIARTAAVDPPEPETKMKFQFDLSKAHFFDKSTEKAVK